ncbi:MAG: hybrid sensor histidine kinase/response regulator [Cellvibrionaceae bacterium]|nr:hybrid sensor histidine kinase/response regulator [Cellvibrionaceae bacterium]
MSATPKTITIKQSATKTQGSAEAKPPWLVLVIDDEQDVLDVTENILKRFQFKGRGLTLKYARSLEAAKNLYKADENVAVAIVDCAMEKNTSGLDFIDFIRNEEKNFTIQLVLRTGQPGFAPENQVLINYEINDYLSKTELTSIKLKHRMISYLRAYENLTTISTQNNQLKQLSRVKDDLLSVVSHELRNPLSASKGLVKLLLANPENINSKVLENLRLIDTCNQRMDLLVSDLIDSAMIKRNDFRLSFSDADIHAVVEDIMPNLHILASFTKKDNDVAIINETPKGLPTIHIDKARIQQAITNLVNNALKFTERGTVTINAEKSAESIRLSVSDTGTGIAKEDVRHIFTMFSQVESNKHLSPEGLGLGLTISKKIIEGHGGNISVSSTLGEGSTFTLNIPLT